MAPDTARRMAVMLTDVVGAEDGTGKRAHIMNVAVAGKLDRAKYDFGRGAYLGKGADVVYRIFPRTIRRW